MRRMISTLIASVTLATCLGAVLTANNSQRGEGWISAPLASARALGASLVMPKSLPGLPNLRSWLTRNSDTNAVQGADGATVQTDKADYTPYENVIITGSGWQPHETVSLLLREDPPQLDHGDLTYEAVADDSGNIRNDEFWTDYYDIGITFVLTATGQDSGLTAQTTFTDLNIGTYDQCSNDLGTGYTTGDEGCRWINGNLQSNNSIYKEGDATVQRVWLTDFVPGSSHTIRLKYGTTKGGKHAYDFLTTWNWSENWISVADRCQDITGCTSAADTTFNIQMDGSVPDTFEPAFGNANHKFVMRGGNITATSVPAIVTGDYTGDSETVTTVSFTVDSSGTMCETKGQTTTCGVALWFGAHVAAQANWGLGLGAGSISGSPYHVALDAIDGASVGQRDNQMQAGVVTAVPNGTIVIIKDAKPDSAPCRILEQNFSFDLHNTPNTITQSFELDDDGPCDATLSNTTTFSVPPGTWSAAELNIPDGWGLSGLSCAVTGTSTTSVNGATATITLQSNDTVTCTFTNSSAALFCTTDAQCGDNNVCTADICDVSTGICTNPPGNAGTVCRTAAGVCDVAETCTGTSATCPADGANLTTQCRAAADACDVAAFCSDASDDCPANGFKSVGTECRAATGVCDVHEVCTGSSAACPADGPNLTTQCRASAGICDVAEFCSDASDACPGDGFVAGGTECAAATGVCDVHEVCTGSSAACPADGPNLTTQCRASAGICDVAEFCSDASDACPGDGFVAGGTECAAATGVCDVHEVCTGSSAACPADGPNLTTQCRASAGICDVAEFCSDASDACPGDGFVAGGTECAAATGVCDVHEVCTGSSAACPADGPNLTTQCRASAGICDVAEFCSDASDACPGDGFVAGGTECAAATGVCDVHEVCTGSSAACPADGPNLTTQCRASAGICDVAEFCSDASDACPGDGFVAAGTECAAATGVCDVHEVCTGSSAACPADGPNLTTQCRASAGICDVAEFCSNASDACPGDGFVAGGTECAAATGVCDVHEVCTGSSAACPADGPNLTTQCRASAGICDVAEFCSDASDACPGDGFVAGGTECAAATGVCDVHEVCTGSSAACPADGPNLTTQCRASAGICDVAEFCSDASDACPGDGFVAGGTECAAATGVCDVHEVCTGSSAACPADGPNLTTQCRPSAGECDVAEFCSDASDDCPANGFKPAGAACGSSADNACTDPDTCKGGENTCLPNNTACSFVTNSELCSFDYDSTLNGRQFNAIFTPDPQLWPGYKLNATNPGQFYYNAIVTGAANTAGSVTMSVPWPFITQGANPVHVYDANSIGIDQNLCFRDGSQLPLFGLPYPATVTYADWASGAPKGGSTGGGGTYSVQCEQPSALPNGLGYDCAVTINFTIPPSGKAYVNLHLDYGVKGQNTDFNPKDTFADRYDKGTNTCVGDATYYDALQNDLLSVPAGPTALATCTWYPFSHDGGGGSNNGNDSIQNVNSFKKISGAFGQAVSQGNGALYQNIPATLTDSTGKVISTGTTDQDGFYALPYAHKGKPALFTITLGTGATKASKVIELHANGWTEADYDPLTLTWYVSVK